MLDFLREMPKIELHCHLDGSLKPELVQRLLALRGETYSIEELKQRMEAPMDCPDLAEYLTRFDLPLRCLQTKEELAAASYGLAEDAAVEQVRYLEVRFAPSFSTQEGLSVREILESVESGLRRAREETGIRTGILVCGMRNLPMEENLAMLREARELFGAGVAGCDLAGDEKAYPTREYRTFFREAKRLGMPFTIHSGECGSIENVKEAIELGAKRLGHGIAMAKDTESMRLCRERRIGVELCPTSNLQTKAVSGMEDYPFGIFRKNGVPVSVNTDNRTVSAVSLTGEFQLLCGVYGLGREELGRIYRDSVEMSFADEENKNALLALWV